MDSITKCLRFPQQSQKKSTEQQLQLYKKNMKIFINQVQKQMNKLIDGYQKQLQTLIKENNFLKSQLEQKKQSHHNIQHAGEQFDYFTPVKKSGTFNSRCQTTTRSNLFDQSTYTKEENALQSTTKKFIYSQEYKVNPLNKSKFQLESQRKKQHHGNLLQSLESGRTNLDHNTNKFLTLVGEEERQQEEVTTQEPIVKKSNSLNTSLNEICDSLDNSFAARRVREKKQKLKKTQEQNNLNQVKKREENERTKKDRSVKNLLKSLRNNIDTSKPPQVIKGTKLVSTDKNSKVMINPVPVDITSRQSLKREGTSKKKSILKQSTILTKSIANISSSSFNS